MIPEPITEKLMKYYNLERIDDIQIEEVDKRIKWLAKDDDKSREQLFMAIIDKYNNFPTAKDVTIILNKTPRLKKNKDEKNVDKQGEWKHILLFTPDYENGNACVLCGSHRDHTVCLIREKGEGSYDKTYLCPCKGS